MYACLLFADLTAGTWQKYFQASLDGLSMGALFALIALGYTMVYGIIELINFAHGDLFMLGTFFALSLLLAFDLTGLGAAHTSTTSIVFACALMILTVPLFTAIVNFSLDRMVYKPLRHASRLAPLVSAIGCSFVFMNLGLFWNSQLSEPRLITADRVQEVIPQPDGSTQIVTTDGNTVSNVRKVEAGWLTYETVPAASDRSFPSLLPNRNLIEGSGLRFTIKDSVVIGVTVPIMILLTMFVKLTPMGKAMRATAQDPTAARLMGINVDRVIGATFMIGGALGGVASVIYSLSVTTIGYQMGFINGLYAFTAAVLGGIGNIPGAVLGGLLIGLIRSYGSVTIGETWTSALVFALLIIILVFKPTGLLGARTREKV